MGRDGFGFGIIKHWFLDLLLLLVLLQIYVTFRIYIYAFENI